MAGLSPPALEHIESERFQVLPLWNWSLAAAKVATGSGDFVGVGFDPEPAVARRKAYSEALERYVYGVWDTTGVSPFTDERCPAPPPASGMAAHVDREQAAAHAFFEWRERSGLAAAQSRQFVLRPIQIPPMGLLFRSALRYVDCELEAYLGARPPFVAFVLGRMKPNGVIFGSACRGTEDAALKAAVAECVRKTASLEEWRRPGGEDAFQRSIRFWLSSEGVASARAFVANATAADAEGRALPEEIDPARLESFQIGDSWICRYSDPRHALPEAYGTSVPLV
jgi:hypothetical protein